MNAKGLMRAIGGISDRHIEEFAVVKPVSSTKSTWLKIVSIAACFAIIVGIANIALNFIDRPTIDEAPEVQACIVGDEYYELIKDEKYIESRGLPQEITANMLGDYIGSCRLESDGRVGKAYDYLGYSGDSVLILELENQYFYLFFCNPMNIDVVISMPDLLDRYGLKDNITSISIDGKLLVVNLESILDELTKANALTGNEFDDAVFKGKTEEEQQTIRKNMKPVEIVISGNSADVLVIDYYPSLGYAYCANTYYEITSEFKNLLEQ
ncbi:MAG: hypothetical protein GX257_06985 [Clostridiales bacterium]|nr:hypothetical protein [Clostridiales bacterium]